MSSIAYASAYQRDRVAQIALYASERQTLTANFVGLLGASPAISRAVWETANPVSVAMSAAVIDGNTSDVTVAAQFPGVSVLRCTVYTDDGRRFVQQFRVEVLPQMSYASDSFAAGVTSLEATAVVDLPDGQGDGGVLDGGGA